MLAPTLQPRGCPSPKISLNARLSTLPGFGGVVPHIFYWKVLLFFFRPKGPSVCLAQPTARKRRNPKTKKKDVGYNELASPGEVKKRHKPWSPQHQAWDECDPREQRRGDGKKGAHGPTGTRYNKKTPAVLAAGVRKLAQRESVLAARAEHFVERFAAALRRFLVAGRIIEFSF